MNSKTRIQFFKIRHLQSWQTTKRVAFATPFRKSYDTLHVQFSGHSLGKITT